MLNHLMSYPCRRIAATTGLPLLLLLLGRHRHRHRDLRLHGRTGRVDLDQFVQMMESTGVWTYQD